MAIKFEKENFLWELCQQMRLDKDESEMFLHDVNNLRGDEWLSVVQESCSLQMFRQFKKLVVS